MPTPLQSPASRELLERRWKASDVVCCAPDVFGPVLAAHQSRVDQLGGLDGEEDGGKGVGAGLGRVGSRTLLDTSRALVLQALWGCGLVLRTASGLWPSKALAMQPLA